MKIKITPTEILGAPIEGTSPLPKFRDHAALKGSVKDDFPKELQEDVGITVKVLPYTVQDRYSRKRVPMSIKTCVLENEYLRAEFWPEYGGRLYSLFDKKVDRELLMKNPVFQPANLAIRDAWLSGGIEWNIGSYGHTFTTCDNMFTAILNDDDGNDFLRMYEFERCTGVFWQMDFHLPDDSKHLICHVKIVNPFDEATTTYWWTNIAVPDTGKTRVLASSEKVIFFMNRIFDYTTLPYIDAMPGADLSYPSQATRGFDYFFQPDERFTDAWEAASYEDGFTFYERSTAPLLYRKLFCWGNHHAGKHWQEYLSDKGTGYYAEIQAGIARSQVHDKVFGANEVIEWTQCFGGMELDKEKVHGVSLHDANVYCEQNIDKALTIELLTKYDKMCAALADKKVEENDLIHYGSGFGALEIMRMKKCNDGKVPENLCFPEFTIGEVEKPWLSLLVDGTMLQKSPAEIPTSWMTGKKWLSLMEESLSVEPDNWFTMLNIGVADFEMAETGVIAAEAEMWDKRSEYVAKAKNAWLKSIELCPSVWAYRNLALWEKQHGTMDKAEEYYEKAIDLGILDFSVAVEYLDLLVKANKYEKAWETYNSLPESMQKEDRVMIVTAYSAVKLQKLDFLREFFEYDHYAIAEGENSLTNVWFEYCATKIAKERGIEVLTDEVLDKLIDEAWEKCPPPESIDFRMSFDRDNKYRVES